MIRNIQIVVLIIVILIVVAFIIDFKQINGGYDKSIFSGKPLKNVKRKLKSKTPDDFFKALLFDEYNNKHRREYVIHVLDPGQDT